MVSRVNVSNNQQYINFLQTILDYERENGSFSLGWCSEDVNIESGTLKQLEGMGFIKQVYKSKTRIGYRAHTQLIEEVINGDYEQMDMDASPRIPDDIFDTIYGQDRIKRLFMKSLYAESPVHLLLSGPPASSKSLFLEEINRLEGSEISLGGLATKVGIRDLIAEQKPRYLLVDEMDKISEGKELSALLSWMESGKIKIDKHNRHEEVTGKGWVFAAANDKDIIPQELLSRFLVLHIPEYSNEQLRGVVLKVLTEREGKDSNIAEHIAEKVVEYGSKNPRDAIKIARLADTREEVDDIVEILKRYSDNGAQQESITPSEKKGLAP